MTHCDSFLKSESSIRPRQVETVLTLRLDEYSCEASSLYGRSVLQGDVKCLKSDAEIVECKPARSAVVAESLFSRSWADGADLRYL
jgi:hypothetical protein